MFCLSFRCEFRFEMFCLLMRTNECVGVKAWVGCSATGFPLSFIIIILCDPAGGLHNNPHKMTKIEDPTAARPKSKPKKKKKKPNRNDPKTGLRSALIRFWGMTYAFEIRIGDLIASQTNGLKCDDNKLISWLWEFDLEFMDGNNAIWSHLDVEIVAYLGWN